MPAGQKEVTSKSQHMQRQATFITPQVKLHTEVFVTPKKHGLALQMMHHCVMLWWKGRILLSWLAFGTSASAATSRCSSNSHPVYIRYQTAARAAAVVQYTLLYHLCN